MRYAIELVFDSATEEKIVELIDGLEEAGVTPTLLEFDERPHISLGLFESDAHEKLLKKIKRLAKTVSCVPLKFENLGLFRETGVVFLAPAPTLELLRIHRLICRALNPYLKKNLWDAAEFYRADDLAFHCTLALRLTPPKILKAVQYVLATPFPRSVFCEGLRLVVLREGSKGMAEEIALFPLRPLPVHPGKRKH